MRDFTKFLLGYIFTAAFILLILSLTGATTTSGTSGLCKTYTRTAGEIDEVGDVVYIKSGGAQTQFQLEPDATGDDFGIEVATYLCTEESLYSCRYLWFDSDYDGIPDNYVFDGITSGKRAAEMVGIAGYIAFVVTTAPGSGEDAELTVCGIK